MSDRIYVRLKIIGESFSPVEFSKITGISPDRMWHIGNRREQTIITEKQSGCIISSGLEETAPLERHLFALYEKLRPHIHLIVGIAKTELVEISCVIYADTRPSIYICSELVQFISSLHANLDVDTYTLTPKTDC